MALLGRSGTGKSTLLRALAGLDPDYEGTILVPDARSVVFQEPRLLPWRRVWANVVLGLPRVPTAPAVDAALAEVGLADRADAWPVTLSGGEAQRVALARALVREPELLLLDEPFAALDALTRLKMHALLRDLWRRHRPAVLLVTHDVDEAIAARRSRAGPRRRPLKLCTIAGCSWPASPGPHLSGLRRRCAPSCSRVRRRRPRDPTPHPPTTDLHPTRRSPP